MAQPQKGDKILVMKRYWMDLLLRGDKTLEIRNRRLKPGLYFLGHKGQVYGSVVVGEGFRISTAEEWNALRPQHRVPEKSLPYKNTFGLPVRRHETLTKTLPYQHPRGAIGLVIYRHI